MGAFTEKKLVLRFGLGRDVTSRDVTTNGLVMSLPTHLALPHHIYHEFIGRGHDATVSPFYWWRPPVLQFVDALLTWSYCGGESWTSRLGYLREMAAYYPCGNGYSLEEVCAL